ncbi:MAG TPA: hypothetical protein VGI74_20060 [Streptosporangiaceae bacterium]
MSPGVPGTGEDCPPGIVRRGGPGVSVLFRERQAELVHLVFNDGEGPPRLQNKGYNGWLGSGKLHNLPPSSGEVYGQAW